MAKEKKVKDPKNKLGIGRLLAFKSSDISAAWVNLIMLNYLTIFASDALGVKPAVVGTLLMVSKIVDAFTDVIAGFVIDNTNTKLGKGRPYELCIIGMVITSVFMFFAKPEWSQFAKYAWIFSMYTLCFSVFATFRTTGMNPYTIRAFSNNPILLRKVSSYGGMVTMAGSIVMSVLFPRLLAKAAIAEGLTKADYPSASAWFRITAMVMSAALIIGLFRFIFIKEDPSIAMEEKKEKTNFSEVLNLFKNNKYTWIFAIMMMCYNIMTNLAIGPYYFRYVVGDVNKQGLLSVVGIILLPLMLSFPKIMEKLGSMCRMIEIFAVIGIVGYLIVFFSGSFLPGVYGGYVLGTLATLPLAYYGILFIMNICNYNEMIGLPRMDGSSGILSGFATKFGAAIGSFITGILLSLSGYIATTGNEVVTQPGSAVFMIRIIFAIVPALMLVVIFLCAKKFGVMEVQVSEWEAEKKAKKEAEAAAAA